MAERSKTFCPLPFIHSHASVNGHWKPCCNSMYASKDNNYFETKTSHLEWFASKQMDRLRSDLLSGIQNPMCDVCWNAEHISGRSIRTRYVEKFSHLVDVNKPKIKYLDLKLSNECNLACRMCDYTNSNQIYKDVSIIEKNNLFHPKHWARSQRHEKFMDSRGIKTVPKHTMDDVKSLLPDLEILKFTGGEPTIIPEVLEIFDICIEKGYAKNLTLNITTNATKLTQRFLKKIQKFKYVHLNISCDGHGKVYDYIRYPFKWRKFTERIDNIRTAIIPGVFECSIAVIPQMYNIENLHKLQKWGEKVDIPITLNNILHPSDNYNSLKFVPLHILESARSRIKTSNESIHLIKTIDSICSEKRQISDTEEREIVKSVGVIDQIRKQNYKDHLEPMTAEWLEGPFKKYA